MPFEDPRENATLSRNEKKDVKALTRVAENSGIYFEDIELKKNKMRLVGGIDEITGAQIGMTCYYNKKTGEIDEFAYIQYDFDSYDLDPASLSTLYISIDVASFNKFSRKSKGAFAALDPHDFEPAFLPEWSSFFDSFKGVVRDDEYSTYISAGLYDEYVFA